MHSNKLAMQSFCVFSNMRINNKYRLERAKNSFFSFCDADISTFIINIRGDYKKEFGDFLFENLGNKLQLTYYESEEGWFSDTQLMIDGIDTKYLFYWCEDNICLIKSWILNCLVQEMDDMNAEHLMYTIYENGAYYRRYNGVPREEGKNIAVINYDEKARKIMEKTAYGRTSLYGYAPFIISLPSFFTTELFKRLILSDDEIPPKLKYSSFFVEKDSSLSQWMPMRTAICDMEIFGVIDDNRSTPGTSLIARGLYPCDVDDRRTMWAMDEGVSVDSLPTPLQAPLSDSFLYSILRRWFHCLNPELKKKLSFLKPWIRRILFIK